MKTKYDSVPANGICSYCLQPLSEHSSIERICPVQPQTALDSSKEILKQLEGTKIEKHPGPFVKGDVVYVKAIVVSNFTSSLGFVIVDPNDTQHRVMGIKPEDIYRQC